MPSENDERAKRFADILFRYGTDCLSDLLADARHWCDRNDACYGDLDKQAYRHYLAELAEERRPS